MAQVSKRERERERERERVCVCVGLPRLVCPTEFHGMDPELLRKALNLLVKRGRAQIFGSEDSLGVKFFRGGA